MIQRWSVSGPIRSKYPVACVCDSQWSWHPMFSIPFRSRRALDNKQGLDEEKITMLEQMVKEATEAANEAERKYDEVRYLY